MLGLSLAKAAQAEHKKLNGRSSLIQEPSCSSSSRAPQGLWIPPYHEQYLAAPAAPQQAADRQERLAAYLDVLPVLCSVLLMSTKVHGETAQLLAAVQPQQHTLQQQVQQQQQHGQMGSNAAFQQLELEAAVPSDDLLLLLLEALLLQEQFSPQNMLMVVAACHSTIELPQRLPLDDPSRGACHIEAASKLLQPMLQLLGSVLLSWSQGRFQCQQLTQELLAKITKGTCVLYAETLSALVKAGERHPALRCDQ
jgi:hypothetical protein